MPSDDIPADSRHKWIKLIIMAAVVGVAVLVYLQFREHLSLDNLAERESELRRFQSDHPVLVCGIAFVVYVTVTGLSLPGATGLTLLYGWYFGFLQTVLLVSFASTTGATIAFLLSRYLLRDTIQSRFGDRLVTFNRALEKEGAFYLFTLRLIPAVPFFVINLVMGLTPVRTRTFWWVSQLGMLPGTFVYVYAGSVVPDLKTLADKGIEAVLSPWQLAQLFPAFVMLGIFPLAVKKVMQWIRPDSEIAASDNEDSTIPGASTES